MENFNTDQIWDNFIESFPYTDQILDSLIGCFKRDNINPYLFANNLFFISGKKVSEKQIINEPTESISVILKEYIPPSYSLFFVAGYPDVVVWFMDNYDSDNLDNIYFKELTEKPEKYLAPDNKLNFLGITLLKSAYKKSIKFTKYECSY